MTLRAEYRGVDPASTMTRAGRLALLKAWFREQVYARLDVTELYDLGEDATAPKLRVPAAKIITNRHLGLEIVTPPHLKIANGSAQTWLTRLLKLNGFRGAMRPAATTKSWAGDVGILFAYRPSEREILGTPWQVGFLEPECYEVTDLYPSGVFRAVEVYSSTQEKRPERPDEVRTFWSRTTYTRDTITVWPRVEGVVRPSAEVFVNAVQRGEAAEERPNTLGVIPFVVVQNIGQGTHTWEGQSDYADLTELMHRLNVDMDAAGQGTQLRNRLMMALIDAEDIEAQTTGGLTALMIRSDASGSDDRQAQLMPTPLAQVTDPFAGVAQVLDLLMEAAGVAQTGSAKELFGNEPASSSALHTFYAVQAAVAQHKRENWLGERPDFGLSALVRKLILAASRVDPASPVYGRGMDQLLAPEYDLELDWPPMFAMSAPERQTLASVAQQGNDDGLPPELLAPLWARVLGSDSLEAQGQIARALTDTQARVSAGLSLRPTGDTAQRGILGSGQGDGLNPDGGSATDTVNP